MMTKDPDDLKYVSEAELASVREQIQEDLRSIFSDALPDEAMDDVCQMVVDNFKKLEN